MAESGVRVSGIDRRQTSSCNGLSCDNVSFSRVPSARSASENLRVLASRAGGGFTSFLERKAGRRAGVLAIPCWRTQSERRRDAGSAVRDGRSFPGRESLRRYFCSFGRESGCKWIRKLILCARPATGRCDRSVSLRPNGLDAQLVNGTLQRTR